MPLHTSPLGRGGRHTLRRRLPLQPADCPDVIAEKIGLDKPDKGSTEYDDPGWPGEWTPDFVNHCKPFTYFKPFPSLILCAWRSRHGGTQSITPQMHSIPAPNPPTVVAAHRQPYHTLHLMSFLYNQNLYDIMTTSHTTSNNTIQSCNILRHNTLTIILRLQGDRWAAQLHRSNRRMHPTPPTSTKEKVNWPSFAKDILLSTISKLGILIIANPRTNRQKRYSMLHTNKWPPCQRGPWD